MKRTLKIMLAAILSFAMLMSFAAATEADTDLVSTSGAYEIHADADALADFADAPAAESWMYQGLNCAVTNGVMNGNAGLLRPSDSLTRAEMTAMMVRVLGAEKMADISAYIDVVKGAWYYDSISAGVGAGLINGSGNKMMPTDAITREQTFVILARTFLFEEKDASAAAKFVDAASVSSWAEEAANALVEAEVVIGDSSMALRPKSNISRAEFATMLDRIVCFFAKADVDYNGAVINGSVIYNDASINLDGATINGDLYITDAVGEDAVDLDNVTVEGRIVIRGGDVTIGEDTTAAEVVEKQEAPVIPDEDEGKTDEGKEQEGSGDSDASDSPNVSTTPSGANTTPVKIDEDGTYISYGDNGEKIYATVSGSTITFDLSELDDVELHNLYVSANKSAECNANGFSEVSFKTNTSVALSEILADMVNSTSKQITKILGITDENGKVADNYTLSALSDMIESAYSFYNNDVSEDKWMQNLFDERDIVCSSYTEASFKGTIGGDEYTIVMIVPDFGD